jgi:hypothetical protein
MKFHNQFEKNRNRFAKLFLAQVKMSLMLVIIMLNVFCLYAAEISPIVLPEKEFVVYDLKVENSTNEVTEGYTVYIDTAPTMPDIIVRIRPEYSLLTANMKYEITYNQNGRNDLKPYSATTFVNSWNVNYNGEFHGGEAVVTVSSGTISQTLTRNLHIRGTNPSKDTVKSGLNIYQQVVVYKESYPRWCQFTTGGLPIFGPPNGWGLMQLDPPSGEEVIWNWHTNRTAGCNMLSWKYNHGLNYPADVRVAGYTQARDWISEEERWTDGFQLYNGGHAYHWVLDDPIGPISGPGRWERCEVVVGPPYPEGTCSGYGFDAWNIKVNVESGNPPNGW